MAGASPATRRQDAKLLIIAGRVGRLANRLVLFANFVAFAEEHGYRLNNCTFHSYADLFETTRRDIYCRYPIAARRSVLDIVPGVAAAIRKTRVLAHAVRMACVLSERSPALRRYAVTLRESDGVDLESPPVQARLSGASRVFFMGWAFRAPAYVERHAAKIRAYFRPVERHDRASRETVERLRRNGDIVVGVHIRHGDYRGWRGGKYFLDIERYAAWMRELADQFPGRRVAFLVCSDEPRSVGEFPGLSVGFGAGVPVQDLCALGRCNYVLGPVSSFSQWASFYGDKPLLHLRDRNDCVEVSRFRVSFLGEVPQ
jgi:hypothetical protein